LALAFPKKKWPLFGRATNKKYLISVYQRTCCAQTYPKTRPKKAVILYANKRVKYDLGFRFTLFRPNPRPNKAIWEIESGVDPKLVALNALPLGGADLFDFLYPNPKRINSGRLNERYLKLWYKCSEAAGWFCNGRFRQTIGEPINVDKKGRVQRYFNPEGGKAPITFLRVPLHIWEKVAERNGKSMPEHIELTDDGEALGFWDWVHSS
jgi:hypothetical protein